MVGSQAKQEVIRRYELNELLGFPLLSQVRKSKRDLSVDQPTGRLEPDVVQAAVKALGAGNTHYAPVPGVDSLRQALTDYVNYQSFAGYDGENVLVTAGVQEARFLSLQKVGEMFNCVAMPEVVHPGARRAAGVRHLEICFLPVDLDNGMLPTVAGIEQALKDGCRLFYLESPVRISGAFYNPCTVEAVADMLEAFGATAIWDQGLKPWAIEDCVALASLPGMASRTITLGEAWPGVGLEGLMIGYLAAKERWWESVRSQKQVQSICTSTASQHAALKVAEVYQELHREQVHYLERVRSEALRLIDRTDAKRIRGGAVNLIAVRLADAEQVADRLGGSGFKVARGTAFGVSHVLRFSVAEDGSLLDALEELVGMKSARES